MVLGHQGTGMEQVAFDIAGMAYVSARVIASLLLTGEDCETKWLRDQRRGVQLKTITTKASLWRSQRRWQPSISQRKICNNHNSSLQVANLSSGGTSEKANPPILPS